MVLKHETFGVVDSHITLDKITHRTDGLAGFYGSTPVDQPASANQAVTAATTTTTATTTALQTDLDAVRVLVNQLRNDLVSLGLIKGAA